MTVSEKLNEANAAETSSITPANYMLAPVNLALFGSSA